MPPFDNTAQVEIPERRVDVVLGVLGNELKHIKDVLERLESKVEALERKNTCNSCGVFSRIDELEDDVVNLKTEAARYKGLTIGISTGVSMLITIVTFVGQWILHAK